MEVWLRGREAIRLQIKSISNDQWVAWARDLVSESAQAWLAGEIDDETYTLYGEELDARREAHAAKAVTHGRFEGQTTKTKGVADFVSPYMPDRLEAEPEKKSLSARPPGQRKRGKSQVPAEVRAARRLWLKGQAKLAKCPYEVWRHYDLAEVSALSIVLLDIYKNGECTRTIKQIAGSAGTSPRTVQAMYARAYARRDLMVERRTCPDTRRSIASRATTLSAEILDYQEGLRRREEPTTPLENRHFYDHEEIKYGGPLEGANSTIHPSAEEPETAVEAPLAAAELGPDHVAEDGETTVLEAPEPVQELEPDPVEDPLPVEECEDHPEHPPRFTYRPSWRPAWLAEEYERRFPKPAPVPVEHHTPITDKLEAARKLVEGHARGTPPVQDTRAHNIEQPAVNVPLDDHWSRLAVKYGIPPRPKPEGST